MGNRKQKINMETQKVFLESYVVVTHLGLGLWVKIRGRISARIQLSRVILITDMFMIT